MTREEAIQILADITDNVFLHTWEEQYKALHMAIEALQTLEAVERIKTEILPQTDLVRCKDCRHANECHKNVQYTHNEQSTITIGYTPIEWCSRGERREP